VGYVRFEGFEIRNSSMYNVWVGGESHHLELVGLNVHDGAASGIWLDGPKLRAAMSVVSGNRVYNHELGGITVWTATGGYYLIEGNEVFGNRGTGNYDGIQVGGGSGATHHIVLKRNVVHDNGSANVGEDGIDLGGHALNHHYLVEGNTMYGGTGSFKLHSGQLKSDWYIPGVSSYHVARFNQFTGKGYVAYEYPNPIAVYNNTFVNCGQCVLFYGEDNSLNQNLGDSTFAGGDAGRMNWKNNLFYQDAPSNDYVLLTAAGPGTATIDLTYRSVRFQNNMYKVTSGQAMNWKVKFGPPITDQLFASFKSSSAPNYPDTGSLLTTATMSQMFVSSSDYHLAAGSPAIDKGAPLTAAVNTGTNSTNLVVGRASYFHDGYCVGGECLNTADSIVVGRNAPVRILSINDLTNVITLATPMTWTAGTVVTLPYSGTAPDIGAFESSAAALPAPSNLRVISVQ
jgi:hypothetical protein